MFCSPVLTVAVFVACVASTTLALPRKAEADNRVIFQISTFNDLPKLRELSGAKLIHLRQVGSPRGSRIYTLGERDENDELVAEVSDTASFGSPQNIKLNLKYPAKGTGAIITRVEVLIDQSSDEGRAYVVSGGIGERSISINIEANNSKNLDFNAKIWGKEN